MTNDAASAPKSLVGTTVGDGYVLDRILGQGRHGVLFDAHHARVGNRYVVRMIRTDANRKNALIAALRQHAELTHPYLNAPRDIIVLPDEQILLTSRFLPGQDLNQRVAAHGKLTASEGLVLMRQASAALHALHQKGVAHGNLTATNLFFTRFDDVSVDNALSDSKGSHIVQLIDAGLGLLDNNAANATPADDQRSLGRIMLSFVSDLSSAQRKVLERTQESRPDARFPSMAELFRAFNQTLKGGRGGEANAVATAVMDKITVPPPNLARRRFYAMAAAALLGLLVVVLVAVLKKRSAISAQPVPPPPSQTKPEEPSEPPPVAPPAAEKPTEKPAVEAPAPEPPAEKPHKKKKKAKKAKS